LIIGKQSAIAVKDHASRRRQGLHPNAIIVRTAFVSIVIPELKFQQAVNEQPQHEHHQNE
jgi:hypothetical protein